MSFYDTVVIACVGIITVFIILSLVWLLGILLIILTNKFSKKSIDKASNTDQKNADYINNKQWVAIVSAVHVFSHGRGKINTIKRIN